MRYFLFILFFFFGCSSKTPHQSLNEPIAKECINIYYRFSPSFKADELDAILQKSSNLPWQQRIDFLSRKFLGTPYAVVKRSEYPKERGLIIQLDSVDCMSFVEYVEALARSKNLQEFPMQLRFVRYRQGVVADSCKRHFFIDWLENGYEDIGEKIAPKDAIKVHKILNADRQISAIAPFESTFFYIPSQAFNDTMLSKLKTGDIIGAYAAKPSQDWLDVTHMGIIIVKNGTPYFRNASSLQRYNEVVDIPLKEYLKRVPGLVVLRKKSIKNSF